MFEDPYTARNSEACHASIMWPVLFQPKHRLGHADNIYYYCPKKTSTGSVYLENNKLKLENKITDEYQTGLCNITTVVGELVPSGPDT